MRHHGKPLGRRFDCRLYPSCLSLAAHSNAPEVRCDQCGKYQPVALGPEGINHEFFAMARLWRAIFEDP